MPFIPPFRTPDDARAPHVVCGAVAASETMQREEAARRAERAPKRTRARNGVDALQEALKANGAKANVNGSNGHTPPSQSVEGTSPGANDATRKPTNAELLEHGTHALDMAAGFAQAVGAEDHADILRKTAKTARMVPVAIEGVKREIAPVAEAGKGLWKALERKGYVGMREPMNMAEMQKRGQR